MLERLERPLPASWKEQRRRFNCGDLGFLHGVLAPGEGHEGGDPGRRTGGLVAELGRDVKKAG